MQSIITYISLYLYEVSLKCNANSHLSWSLKDEQKVHNIRIEKLLYILHSWETNSK